jgi:hypothetical protein
LLRQWIRIDWMMFFRRDRCRAIWLRRVICQRTAWINSSAALYRVVITRMRGHQPTLDYVKRRTAEGKSKPEIIRCLKRYVAREIFAHLCATPILSKSRRVRGCSDPGALR